MRSDRDKKIIQVLGIILGLNLAVSLAKLIYGYITHSLSLEADGFHSLVDSSSNIIGLVGIILASKPPDEGHPYGHRKIEAVATLVIAFLLYVTCFEIISNVIDRLKNPVFPHVDFYSFFIMGVTILINLFVYLYEKREGEKLKSDILIADSLHTKSDLLVSASVILSFVGVIFKIGILDVIIAIGIVLFIIYVAYRIISGSINILIDAQLIDPQMVIDVVGALEGIDKCHKIRSRGTRGGIFVDLHIHVNPLLSTEASHKITHHAIKVIKDKFPEVIDVLIHTEPSFVTDKKHLPEN